MNAAKISGATGKLARSTHDLVMNSLLYLELKAEHEEILKHKWIESEKLGRDIGFDVAMINWRLKHRSSWRKWWRQHAVPE